MSSDAFKSAKKRAVPPPLPSQKNDGRWGPPSRLVQVTPPPVPKQVELLNLEDVSKYKNLLVFAKAVIDGYFSGKHKSADYGSNAEFAEHKAYNQGDQIEHIDWRVYAKTRDVYVRRYREETDMAIYLVVDMSGSMAYQGKGKEPKFQRVARIAASLAYLMIHQGDKVSLTLYHDKIEKFLPPAGTRRHLHEIVSALEYANREQTNKTSLADVLNECGAMFKKKGRIVVLSDFFEEPEAIFDSLGRFLHRGFEILLYQIMDRDELELPDLEIASFVDSETGEQIQVSPGEIRKAYTETLQRYIDDLQDRSVENGVRFTQLHTDSPYLEAIETYLEQRAK
ncbi:MAG: DUF58 domain-containing protein [Verrucomicrobiales bacterium]|nr:DUF58 domain-containing protein [Verrucomicrobiales bacterium]